MPGFAEAKKVGRIEKSSKNAKYGLLCQGVYIAMAFFVRFAMIRCLGLTAVSLNGLFTQVLGILALSEMGVGLAASYHLYRPLAEGDRGRVSGVMRLLRNAYYGIAIFILFAGLCLMPFLTKLVKGVDVPVPYLRLVFGMFILQTAVSYIGSYKTILLSADQNAYITSKISMILRTACSVVEIACLVLMRNFLLYLVLEIAYQAAFNIAITRTADGMYPYLDAGKALTREEKGGIFLDIRRIFVGRVSNKILNSTDNILVSVLVGTSSVGVYSQYSMFANGFLRLFAALNESMVGSVGNVIASETGRRTEETYRHAAFLFFAAALVTGGCFCGGISPFLRFAAGEEYVMAEGTVYIVALNLVFEILKMPLWTYYSAAGMFESDQAASAAGCALNIVSSILFGKKWGMTGIFLGTFLSLLAMYVWKLFLFHRKFGGRAGTEAWYVPVSAAVLAACGKVTVATGQSLLDAILRAGICGVIAVLSLAVLFGRTEEAAYCLGLLGRFRKEKRRK